MSDRNNHLIKTTRLIKPVHPGTILLEEFLEPMNISRHKLAKSINVSATQVNEIIKGKRNVTVDMASRLSLFFGNSAEFWLGLQNDYLATVT